MAIGLPFHDQSRSPADALPKAAHAGSNRPTFGRKAPVDETLDLGLVRAVIQDGLLMVFGPDGDPIPPPIFKATATAQPDAGIQLRDGPRVPAERVAAVLDAQTGGRLGSGEDGDDAWIEAMLGIGAQPETANQEDLQAEDCTVEVIAFGKELLITSQTGATFLLTEARSRVPESVCLRVANAGPIAVSDLVARLIAGTSEHGTDDPSETPGEFAAPDCQAWIEGDHLVIDLPGVGTVHLARSVDDVGAGALASVFMSSGETAGIEDLVRALGRSSVTPPATGCDSAMAPVDAAPRHSVPLHIDLPDALAAGPDRVALVVVRGLPGAASLSAGVASSDGSWLLSPRNLAGLSLTMPPGPPVEFPLEVVAITVASRDGELASTSRTVVVPLRSDVIEPAPASIPLGLDPQELSEGGPFDAIMVLDVPAGATLSAGTYDPEIDAWVLLPRQLSELSVIPAMGHDQDFTLSVLGVCLHPGDRAGPHVLAQVPVTVR